MTNDILIIILVVIVGLLVMFFVPQWRVKRTIPKVIRTFRESNAVGANNAKTIDALGLKPRGMMEGMFRGRDYRQYALRALINIGVIEQTGDGRFYLSEERLMETGLDRRTMLG